MVPALLAYCDEEQMDLLIARCDGADQPAQQALSLAGLTMLEAQILFRGPVFDRAPFLDGVAIREPASDEADAVTGIAAEAFTEFAGHYHADPRLANGACRDGYVDWTLRGMAAEGPDRAFYIAETDDRPVAYAMFDRAGEEARAALAAVSPAARGRGLYVALLRRGIAWAAGRGASTFVALTPHSNVAAQRSFLRVGLLPTSSTVTFHGWRDRLALAAQVP
jgi:GNAT superfamily N-acetyltransferase